MDDKDIDKIVEMFRQSINVIPPVLSDYIRKYTSGHEYRVSYVVPLGNGYGLVVKLLLRPNGSVHTQWCELNNTVLWEYDQLPRMA